MNKTVAALYVQTDGCYYGLDDVDPWDEARDARQYDGPWPVVAHPPCARWGRYWFGGPAWIASGKPRKTLGDDDGCFAAALSAVRRWGGVLEHPAGSHAWRRFGLNRPPRSGGWIVADFDGGWTCCVEQGHYGHLARKATWLYAVGFEPPPLKWGMSDATAAWAAEGRSDRSISRSIKDGVCVLLSHRQRAATPEPFRDLLLDMAGMVTLRPVSAPFSKDDLKHIEEALLLSVGDDETEPDNPPPRHHDVLAGADGRVSFESIMGFMKRTG